MPRHWVSAAAASSGCTSSGSGSFAGGSEGEETKQGKGQSWAELQDRGELGLGHFQPPPSHLLHPPSPALPAGQEWSGVLLPCLPPALTPQQGQELPAAHPWGDSSTLERLGGVEMTPASSRCQGVTVSVKLSLGSPGPLMVLGILGVTWTSHGPLGHLDLLWCLGPMGSFGPPQCIPETSSWMSRRTNKIDLQEVYTCYQNNQNNIKNCSVSDMAGSELWGDLWCRSVLVTFRKFSIIC